MTTSWSCKISQETYSTLARRLFYIKVSNSHWHLTLSAMYLTCMALHRTRVNLMQVAFLNWHQAGICCYKSMSTPNAAANQSLWDSKWQKPRKKWKQWSFLLGPKHNAWTMVYTQRVNIASSSWNIVCRDILVCARAQTVPAHCAHCAHCAVPRVHKLFLHNDGSRED